MMNEYERRRDEDAHMTLFMFVYSICFILLLQVSLQVSLPVTFAPDRKVNCISGLVMSGNADTIRCEVEDEPRGPVFVKRTG